MKKLDEVDPEIKTRASRFLLGSLALDREGGEITGDARSLPFQASSPLRRALLAMPHLKPFAGLPSKENGLDIEGLTVAGESAFLGLRGPVVDNVAVIVALSKSAALDGRVVVEATHFVDLEGLGVRDLIRYKRKFLVLAGPVSSADGPFLLYAWRPKAGGRIEKPERIDTIPSGLDHPEAISLLERNGVPGLLVLHDTLDKARFSGMTYLADWFRL